MRKDTGFVRSIRRVQQATYPAAFKNEIPGKSRHHTQHSLSLQSIALLLECVAAQIPDAHRTATKLENVGKVTHSKGTSWLSGIINVVKPGAKTTAAEVKTPRPNEFSPGASANAKGKPSKDTNSRSRKESRNPGLRLERRARSSSLDTTCTYMS